MARFKSYIGKQVMLAASVLVFNDEVIETDDDAIIAALSKAAEVDCIDEDGNVIDKPKLPEKSAGGGASGSNGLQEKLDSALKNLEKAEAYFIAESDARKKAEDDLLVERGLREKAEADLADAIKKLEAKEKPAK